MSLRHKLLSAISRDPKNAADLAEELDLDRKVIQDNISAAIKEGLAERKVEDGHPIYVITAKGMARLNNPNSRLTNARSASGAQAQPAVAENTGSSAPDTSSVIPTGGAAPIIYTAETAEITQELAMALDLVKELRSKIAEQQSIIDNLRIECNNLEAYKHPDNLTPVDLIAQLEQIIGDDFVITIRKGGLVTLTDRDSSYTVETDMVYSFIEACRFIRERKVA